MNARTTGDEEGSSNVSQPLQTAIIEAICHAGDGGTKAGEPPKLASAVGHASGSQITWRSALMNAVAPLAGMTRQPS